MRSMESKAMKVETKNSTLFKIFISLVYISITLILSVAIIKLFGIWGKAYLVKLILIMIVGILVNYISLFLIFKIDGKMKNFLVKSLIAKFYWILFAVFFLLTVLVWLLMLRSGAYQSGEVIRVAMIYISVAVYIFGSILGVKK